MGGGPSSTPRFLSGRHSRFELFQPLQAGHTMLVSGGFKNQDPDEAERVGAAKPGNDVSGIVQLQGVNAKRIIMLNC